MMDGLSGGGSAQVGVGVGVPSGRMEAWMFFRVVQEAHSLSASPCAGVLLYPSMLTGRVPEPAGVPSDGGGLYSVGRTSI